MESNSSMGRALDVLTTLAQLTRTPPHRATVAQVAGALDRDRSQVSRTLKHLAEDGSVLRRDDRSYELGWRGYATAQELTERRLRIDGLTLLEGLARDTGEACFIGVLSGDSTVTIVEALPRDARMIGSWLGRPYPAFCSDAGQGTLWDADDDEVAAVLAAADFRASGPNAPVDVGDFLERLERARRRGYSIVDEEAEPGLYSVGAPIWDFRGEVIAAVQIVGARAEMVPKSDELGAAVARTAARLSEVLAAPAC
ncbi:MULTISPECIES: IclR family transcriptional regulator [unclassified Pseudoclavibacter]|uniref:IclR family transcriptional regulator n=1 Tax=unclassified Pseudoclavibacter TaxID=2615177 RepID=UPI0021575ABD|nr:MULTISPECIES: IclR family transcriptional regulator C-terminal domain-containing protein [unclassified Pseudoclavibacter]